MIIRFEWHPAKSRNNLRKHRVGFDEATTVFGDPLAATFNDPDHSVGEERLITLGLSHRGRILAVMHTETVVADPEGEGFVLIRIISARFATQRERNAYEEEA